MKKSVKNSKKQPQSDWGKYSQFAYGALIFGVIGGVLLAMLDRGIVLFLIALLILAIYTFMLTMKNSQSKSPKNKRAIPLLGILVIATVSIAGTYFLTSSFAWHPQGKITKTVQNVTTGGAVINADSANSALVVKQGDILNYAVTVSNIAPPAGNSYNDLAFVIMKDNLPEGVELVGYPGIRSITENFGTILPGQKVVKNYQVKVLSAVNAAILENKACYTGDSVVKDNPQSGCDIADIEIVTTDPGTPSTVCDSTTATVVGTANTTGQTDSKFNVGGTDALTAQVVVTGDAGCTSTVTLASWKTPNNTDGLPLSSQKIFNQDTKTFPIGTHPISVAVPPCYYKAVLIHGGAITDPMKNSEFPASQTLGWTYGGTGGCTATTPNPTPTPTPPTSVNPTPPASIPVPDTPTVAPPFYSSQPVFLGEATTQAALANTGPGSVIVIALFALIGGYVVHTLYWHVKSNGSKTRSSK